MKQPPRPQQSQHRGITRRAAIALGSTATLALLAPRAYAFEPVDDRLRLGIVGVGGRGAANMAGVKSQRIVALCDTNPNELSKAGQQHPDATACSDWRELLAQDGLDGVVISTADHHHALVSIAAMRKGLHVYCEKPLGHTPWEARQVQLVYSQYKDKVVTQMGTQIHAEENYRRVVELVQAGAVGTVKEAHVWCNRSIAPLEAVELEAQPVPEGFDWNAWLGPAADRPYNTSYWRGGNLNWNRRWDFGNGVVGDMGSHLVDLAYWALELRDPTSVESDGPEPDAHAAPPWQQITWEHPARAGDGPHRAACKVVWYHGPEGMKRRADLLQPMVGQDTQIDGWGIGVAFVGDKGVLTADYGKYVLSPSAQFKDYLKPQPTIEKSKGHHAEWLAACKGQGQTLCNFDYSGKLIEHNLLGVAAHRAGGKLNWDAKRLTFGSEAADRYLSKTYRDGWALKPEDERA